ncbi:MAG: hypothetical protein V3S51_09165 [Dehalococcoidia bacterium]
MTQREQARLHTLNRVLEHRMEIEETGWVLWLAARPKRLAEYLLRGRMEHLQVTRKVDRSESHDRVNAAELVHILAKRGFRVHLVPRRGGSFLKAVRTPNAAREFEPPTEVTA